MDRDGICRDHLSGHCRYDVNRLCRNAVIVSADKLALLRERVKDADMLAARTRSADRLVDRPVRGVEAARPCRKGKNAFETKNFAKWASKGYAARLLAEVKSLTLAYLLTGDRRYGEAAVKRGLAVARLDPNGPTSRRVSDFADGSCMEAMALVYDCCYDQLDADERALMRDAMIARTAPWFTRQMNSLEDRVFSAHIWQHILQQTTDVALAVIQVTDNNKTASLDNPIRQADGVIRASNWRITAALDPAQNASLLIQRADDRRPWRSIARSSLPGRNGTNQPSPNRCWSRMRMVLSCVAGKMERHDPDSQLRS